MFDRIIKKKKICPSSISIHSAGCEFESRSHQRKLGNKIPDLNFLISENDLDLIPTFNGDGNYVVVSGSKKSTPANFSVRRQRDGTFIWGKSKVWNNPRVIGLDQEYVAVLWSNFKIRGEVIEVFRLSDGQSKVQAQFPTR